MLNELKSFFQETKYKYVKTQEDGSFVFGIPSKRMSLQFKRIVTDYLQVIIVNTTAKTIVYFHRELSATVPFNKFTDIIVVEELNLFRSLICSINDNVLIVNHKVSFKVVDTEYTGTVIGRRYRKESLLGCILNTQLHNFKRDANSYIVKHDSLSLGTSCKYHIIDQEYLSLCLDFAG